MSHFSIHYSSNRIITPVWHMLIQKSKKQRTISVFFCLLHTLAKFYLFLDPFIAFWRTKEAIPALTSRYCETSRSKYLHNFLSNRAEGTKRISQIYSTEKTLVGTFENRFGILSITATNMAISTVLTTSCLTTAPAVAQTTFPDHCGYFYTNKWNKARSAFYLRG